MEEGGSFSEKYVKFICREEGKGRGCGEDFGVRESESSIVLVHLFIEKGTDSVTGSVMETSILPSLCPHILHIMSLFFLSFFLPFLQFHIFLSL